MGIVFTHGVQMGVRTDIQAAGKSLSGLYHRNPQVQDVDEWQGHWLGG